MKTEFYYPSHDGLTKIHATVWEPAGVPVAVLQLCHGMCEHMGRYDDFANYMAENGYYVVGNDHLGHGASVVSEEKHGYFADPNGNECVIADIHTLRTRTQEKFPELPYFMLGHSMGSFLVRQYIEDYGKGLAGVIVMGTGSQANITLALGKMACKRSARKHGWAYHDDWIERMAFGRYNKQFEPARTPSDWLTKDEAIVDSYKYDPWCSFTFTVNAYYHMFSGIQEAQKMSRMEKIPNQLPMFLVSGALDPVGANGKGVKKAYQSYKRANMSDIMMQLYEGDRHEILNELDRDEVYADLLTWMEAHRESKA